MRIRPRHIKDRVVCSYDTPELGGRCCTNLYGMAAGMPNVRNICPFPKTIRLSNCLRFGRNEFCPVMSVEARH